VWRAFLIAARFLTRWPLPDPGPGSDADLGLSVALHPVVGLTVGALLFAAAALLPGAFPAAPGVAAALVLVAWVWVTGGLHLDGLADTADAWIGGMGDRERTLAIMKDPNSGPFGVTALVLVLLCKWTAIASLLGGSATIVLLWLPVLARTGPPLLFLTTPYVRPGGLGARFGAHLRRRVTWLALALAWAASALFLGGLALVLLAAWILLFALWRRFLMRRLQGFTGDTAGALVELGETLMLAAAV